MNDKQSITHLEELFYILFSYFDINKFYKRLILGNLTEKYLDELPLLAHLEYLEIKTHVNHNLWNKLTRYVASSTQLYYLSLFRWCLELEDHVFLSLHSLRLSYLFSKNEFIYLLRQIPDLIYLYLCKINVKMFSLIDGVLSNIHHCLIYFRLLLTNGFTHSQLDFYLAHISNIKSFHFSTAPCLIGLYEVLNSMANIIQKRLLILQRFLCFIIFEIILNDPFDITKIHKIYNQNYSVIV